MNNCSCGNCLPSDGMCASCGGQIPARKRFSSLSSIMDAYATANGNHVRAAEALRKAEAGLEEAEVEVNRMRVEIAKWMRSHGDQNLIVIRRDDGTNVVISRDMDRVTITIVETAASIHF